MTREQYIQSRLTGNLPVELLYEYYLENCEQPIVTDLNLFIQSINIFVKMFSPDFNQFFKYYDVKYNINILRDKENNIIKVY